MAKEEPTDDLATINALAVMFKRDRRAVASRLANVEPVRVKRRGKMVHRLYRVSEVRDLILAPSDAEAIRAATDELLNLRAGILSMKRALRQREYISAEEYELEVANHIATANRRLQALPGKLADRLAGLIANTDSQKAWVTAAKELIGAELDQLEVELLSEFSWERNERKT